MAVPVITTHRLVLRPHDMSNLEKLHQWQNDPELLYFNCDQIVHQTMAATQRALRRWIEADRDDVYHLAIIRRDSQKFIGFCQIAFIDRINRRCKLGITIGDRQDWGKGFGREAIDGVVRHCFREMELHRIAVEVYAFNQRAIRLFERAGFKLEGTQRDNVFKDQFFDELIFGILASEWEHARTIFNEPEPL